MLPPSPVDLYKSSNFTWKITGAQPPNQFSADEIGKDTVFDVDIKIFKINDFDNFMKKRHLDDTYGKCFERVSSQTISDLTFDGLPESLLKFFFQRMKVGEDQLFFFPQSSCVEQLCAYFCKCSYKFGAEYSKMNPLKLGDKCICNYDIGLRM